MLLVFYLTVVCDIIDDCRTKRVTRLPYYTQEPSHELFYNNIADHLQFGAPLAISLELAKATIQFIRATEESASMNRAIEIQFDF